MATTREAPPKYKNDGGNVQILCPFCEPSHPIYPHKISACGTLLKVAAVQTVYPARTLKKAEVVCVKCGKPGGEMVAYGRGFVHVQECNPERKLLAEAPTYSEWARRVYNMPNWLRGWLERFTGAATEVIELDGEGRETGRIIGYYFAEAKRGRHFERKHSQADAG